MSLLYDLSKKEENQEVNIYLSHSVAGRSLVPLLQNGKKIEALNSSVSDTYRETLPDGKTIDWVLPHSKNFPEFIKEHFSSDKYFSKKEDFIKRIAGITDDASSQEPFPYQRFVYEYLRYGTPYRSLLLEHGLGSGKSREAIMIAESFRRAGLHTLILTPAFLKLNFMDEIRKWGDEDIAIADDSKAADARIKQRVIDQYYHFVHYNAMGVGPGKPKGGKGGMFESLAKLGIGFSGKTPQGKAFPYILENYGEDLQPPKNMLIIIEEAHGLNRSFIKGAEGAEANGTSKVKAYLYSLLMQAQDCKFIALTGTPMISNPFELAPLYNILRGPIGDNGTAFPLDEGSFNDMFIDYEHNNADGTVGKLVNQDMFIRRIIGLGSFFKGITDDTEGLIYPARRDVLREIPMTTYQTYEHDRLLTKELQKKERKPKLGGIVADAGEGKTKTKTKDKEMTQGQAELQPTSNYRMSSRQACNFVFPSAIPRPQKGDKGTWEQFLKKDNVFEFRVPDSGMDFKVPGSIAELKSIVQFLTKQQVTIEPETLEYLSNPDADVDEAKRILTRIISEVYTEKTGAYAVPLKHPRGKPKPGTIYYILSKRDVNAIKMYMGELKDRLVGSIVSLFTAGDKYLSLKALATKYSPKMAEIYRTIVDDAANGAARTVPIDDTEDLAEDVEEEDFTEFINADEVQGDAEDEDDLNIEELLKEEAEEINDLGTPKTMDPDDPMRKHMDIFKSDAELQKLGLKVVGGPAIVYSNFKSAEGAGIFGKVLDVHGFTEYNDTSMNVDPNTIKRAPRYAFIRGGMHTRLKVNVMKVFNSKANVHGQLIKVVFVTQAAAEGISLFNVRQIHLMEPFWDNVLLEQVTGRGFRLRAHQYIREREDRVITVFKYVAVRASAQAMAKVYKAYNKDANYFEFSTDQYIVDIAKRKDRFRADARLMRARAAVDCVNNSSYNELGVDCFVFRNKQGRAYNVSIDDDAKETEGKLVGTYDVGARHLPGIEGIPKDANYTKFESEPEIIVTAKGKTGAVQHYPARKVYLVPNSYEKSRSDSNPWDISTLMLVGYQITYKGVQKYIPLSSNIKEGKLMAPW